jgi:RecG-like helicase/REP element-mobilizing transposase RayT
MTTSEAVLVPPGADPLATPISVLRGIGPERVVQLARLGLHTVGDVLWHRPRRYEDRRQFRAIRELREGESATVLGRITAAGAKRFRSGRKVFEFVLEDGTARLHCRWWNLAFIERLFAVGDEVLVYGKPLSLRPRTMDHPETEKLEAGDEPQIHVNRVVPIYPLTEGLPQRALRALAWRVVREFAPHVAEPAPALVPVGADADAALLTPAPGESGALFRPGPATRWPARAAAVRALHFPADLPAAERARQRLALDEFVTLQLSIQRRRQNLERHAEAQPCAGDNRWMKPFLNSLGFPLTAAQTRVLKELRADLGGPVPMRRLLQGDVGSGKTVVAACAALMTLESGRNVAVMAPTEILAEQLHRNLRGWFEPFGVEVALRTGSRKESGGGFQPARADRQAAPELVEGSPVSSSAPENSLTPVSPFFDRALGKEACQGRLPHWRQAERLYFVTFRLADSVAQPVLKKWRWEREQWVKAHPEPWTDDTAREFHRRFTRRMEELLDAGGGSCWLARPAVGELVAAALRHFDGDRYQLGDFVVMPNHVHVLVRPAPEHKLEEILHAWKSYTAGKANGLLGRTGSFWQEEYYDHLVRSERQLAGIQEYIRLNPLKARLEAGAYVLGDGSFRWPPEDSHPMTDATAVVQGGEAFKAGDGGAAGDPPRRPEAGATLVVGTHALVQEAFGLERLGLVVIDEQHKFGVAQREALVRKGRYPHLLVMTATPIPRTLGLTLYGDLDVSVLDELPGGRGRIRTHLRAADALPKVWEFLRGQLDAGRQAYVVCPRVEESDRDDVKAVTREFDVVRKELAPRPVGLLHGQLPAAEKERVMTAFRRRELAVLVATGVIEVGVDVANATVMLIQNAEQFGLAQLHQLRGRIGRGRHESHCILVADLKTEAAAERLKVLAGTTDGFALAEADLRLRGPGELLGRQQSGLPDFRFGHLAGDRDLVELARGLVRRHLCGAD